MYRIGVHFLYILKMKKTTLLLIGLLFVSLCATSQENTQKAIKDGTS